MRTATFPTCGAPTRTTGQPCRTYVSSDGDRCHHHRRTFDATHQHSAWQQHLTRCQRGEGWGITRQAIDLTATTVLTEYVCAGCGWHSIWVMDTGTPE